MTPKRAFQVSLHSTQRNSTVPLNRPLTESVPGQVKPCQHLVLIVVEVMLLAKILLLFIAAFPQVVLNLPQTTYSSDKGNVIVFFKNIKKKE